MTEEAFHCAIFQLADLWTDSISTEAYVTFLKARARARARARGPARAPAPGPEPRLSRT